MKVPYLEMQFLTVFAVIFVVGSVHCDSHGQGAVVVLSRKHRQALRPLVEAMTCSNDNDCQYHTSFLVCDKRICICPNPNLNQKLGSVLIDTAFNQTRQRCEAKEGAACHVDSPVLIHCEPNLQCKQVETRVGKCFLLVSSGTSPAAEESKSQPEDKGHNSGVTQAMSVIFLIALTVLSLLSITLH